MSFTRLRILLLALLALLPARAFAAPVLLDFNFGIPTSDHINIYVAQDLGLFQKVGLNPKFFLFQSGAPLLAGLKSESLDVVSTGLGVAFALGQNIPLKILFWTSDDLKGEGLVADPKGPIKSFHDISPERRIGAASGTCAQVALYLIAQKNGIDYSKLNVINIPAPLFHNALLSRSIDAGIAWSPYSAVLQSQGFPVVNWDTDYTPPGGMCPRVTAVRPDFLQKHPEIGLKLLQVDAMASEAIAKIPQLAVDALTKRLGLTPDVAKTDIERIYAHRPTYAEQLDPASPYSMTSKDGGLVQKLIEATQILFKTGSIPAAVPAADIQNAVDPSALQQFSASSGSK